MPCNTNELFNFLQGSDVTGESSFDIWKRVATDKSEGAFLEFLRTGPKGETGLSVFEEWYENGNEGKTYEDFLNSIKGEQGIQGPIGKSVYDVWLEIEGNKGKSRDEFFASINESAIGGAIAEEIEARNAAISKCLEDAKSYTDSEAENAISHSKIYTDQSINNEIKDRNTAIANAKADLNTYIDQQSEYNLNMAKLYTNNEINSEVTNRNIAISQAADAVKLYADSKIESGLSEGKKYTEDEISQERTERVNSISSTKIELTEYVNSQIVNTTDNYTDLINKEVIDRKESDDEVRSDLTNYIDSEIESTRKYVDTQMTTEVTARVNADNAIKDELTDYIDGKVNQETTDRISADNSIKTDLTKYVDSKVSTILENAKNYTNTQISNEASARTNADESLNAELKEYIDANIETEVADRDNAIAVAVGHEVSDRIASVDATKTELTEYTDDKVSTESSERTTAIDNAKTELKGYTDTKSASILESSKSYTDSQLSALVNGAPETMNTLKSLSDLINSNNSAVDALNVAIGTRALNSDLVAHTDNTTVHITSQERTKWNVAKTHADSAHAPSNAEANQNAFSNIIIGSTTIAADTKTDSLTLVGSNVTLTPDATNDKVTIGITKSNVTTALGFTPAPSNILDSIDIDYTKIEFDTTKIL